VTVQARLTTLCCNCLEASSPSYPVILATIQMPGLATVSSSSPVITICSLLPKLFHAFFYLFFVTKIIACFFARMCVYPRFCG